MGAGRRDRPGRGRLGRVNRGRRSGPGPRGRLVPERLWPGVPALYNLTYTDFDDVNSGFNGGFYSHPGYDQVTGLGSPRANALIPELASYGLASQMSVTFQPPASVIAGDGFGVVVSADDALGTLDTSFSGTATLALSSDPTGSTFTPVTVTFANGQAIFDGLSLNDVGSGYTFKILSPPFAPVTTNDVDVIANPTPSVGTYYPVPTDASLRAAIDAANADGFASNVIVLGSGIYRLDNTALGQLVIEDFSGAVTSKTLTIEGQGEAQTTIEPSTARGWTDRIFGNHQHARRERDGRVPGDDNRGRICDRRGHPGR